MANRGVQFVYYTANLPNRSIPIAKVVTTPESPSQLTDVNNAVYEQGALTMTQLTTPFTVVTAPDLQVSKIITGAFYYQFANQFFELTDQTDGSGNPLYYQHLLPNGVTNVTVLDLNGNIVPSGYVVRALTRGSVTANFLLHSLPCVNNTIQPYIQYQVRYVDPNTGVLDMQVLKFYHVIAPGVFTPSESTYIASTIVLWVNDSATTYHVRWYANNGYQILQPYNDIPNDPWRARIRFSLADIPPEYGNQVWTPQKPYQLGTWVPGSAIATHLIQFERRPILYNNQYPDVLVYDKNYILKYALTDQLNPGFLYPWRKNQYVDIDPNTGVLQVAVELDPADIIFGFYSYAEPDVVFTDLDINPYTNPTVRNRVVTFYMKKDGIDPLHYIYYKILDEHGTLVATNDAAPGTGTAHTFGTLLVGQAVAARDFTFTDARQRGGGLTTLYQTIPQAVNFWDLGFWDGKPFPAGGAMMIYLPVTLQNTFTEGEIAQIIGAIIPMGTIPVIRFYDSEGNETV
jgi:hypothetical protein